MLDYRSYPIGEMWKNSDLLKFAFKINFELLKPCDLQN